MAFPALTLGICGVGGTVGMLPNLADVTITPSRASTETVEGFQAAKYPVEYSEQDQSYAVYVGAKNVWTLRDDYVDDDEYIESHDTPHIGGTITDEDENVHTILKVTHSVPLSFYRLETIDLALANDLYQTVTVETPTVTSDAATGRSETFAALRSAVRCRIQPDVTEDFEARGMRATQTTYSVWIDPSTGTGSTFAATNANGDWCRLLWGSVYLMIDEYRNAERLDELPMLRCRRVP